MALMVVVVVHLRSPRQRRIWMMGGDAPADWGVGAPLPHMAFQVYKKSSVTVWRPVQLTLSFRARFRWCARVDV